MDEALLLRGALAGYGAAFAGGRWPRAAQAMLAAAVGLHTGALALRWAAHGHGPFTTLHEVLSSNLWSLALIFLAAAARWPEVRAAWRAAWPVLALLAAWLLASDGGRGHFPATYATTLLYLHAVAGKLFLGLLLVAVALALLPLARSTPAAMAQRAGALAWAFAGAAFVAESLMLVIGAAWAQDAWGRYWAWDPLETWAFATWLALAAALHARHAQGPAAKRHALWRAGVFVIAFLTFFGVPFLSAAPHQGAL